MRLLEVFHTSLVVFSQWHVQGWFYWLRCTSRYFFLLCLQARDASHHGWYGPEGQFYARLSVAIPQVLLLDEVVVPVVCSDICPEQWKCRSCSSSTSSSISQSWSVFSAQLDSLVDTCGASVYEAFWMNFGVVQTVQKSVVIPHAFLDKVVDMPVGVSGALWFIRSCSSSTRSWR